MFSGGDSSGDGVNSLNQYSNFRLPGQGAGSGNGSIDWALLAAQWIQMRDNSTSSLDVGVSMGIMSEIPPPPPSISITDINYQLVKSMHEQHQQHQHHQQRLPQTEKTEITTTTSTNIKKTAYEEKGEADMDMDDDDDFVNNSIVKDAKFEPSSPPPPAPSMQLSNSAVVAPPIGIMQPPHWYVQQQTAVQLPTPITIPGVNIAGSSATAIPWPAWPPRVSVPPPSTASTVTGAAVAPITPSIPSSVNATAHIPSLMKLNVANPNVMKAMTNAQPEIDPSAIPPIDTAKRKILPAWIREGLEKMEREKQKQMERQQMEQHNNVISPREILSEKSEQSTKLVNELTVKHMTTNALESGASSGNDDDEPDDHIDAHHTKGIMKAQQQIAIRRNSDSEAEYERMSKHKTSTIHNDDVADERKNDTINDSDGDGNGDEDAVEQQQVSKGYEERLADLMIIVRRTLTELLLEVTNDEISSIAQETIKSHKIKASSAQVIRKSALSSITGKLGLAAYANTSSDEDSDASDNDKSDHDDKDVDSEEEIKAAIRQKRRNFAKISEEIEERILANAQREEQKLKYYMQAERNQNEMTTDGNQKLGEQDRVGDVDAERYGGGDSRRGAVSGSDVGKGFEREFGETTTETKLPHSNGKRSKLEHSKRKERTTRFSDNKDNKAASLAYITQIQKQQQQQQQQSQQQNSTIATTSNSSFPLKNTVSATDALNTLYAMPTIYNTAHAISGISNVLSAAESVLEKAVAKQKSSSSSSSAHKRRHPLKRQRHSSEHDKRKQRRSRSSTSTSTTTSSTSSSSTTTSSSSSSSATTSANTERSHSNSSRRRVEEHRKHHSRSKHHKRSDSRSRSSNKQQQQQQQKHASSSSSSYDRKRSERSHYESHSRHRRQHRRRHSSESDDYRKSRSRSRSPYTSSSSRHRRRRHH